MFSLSNISEAFGSIKANPLRATLTALIIGIGITALVGILTAIDGIKLSVYDGMEDLGANSFDISTFARQGRKRHGMDGKRFPKISYDEAVRYKSKMGTKAIVAIYVRVSWNTEVKYGSVKSNPNINVFGGDENAFYAKGMDLVEGRIFSATEIEFGMPVCVIGPELSQTLFQEESPVNKVIQAQGQLFKIIGLLKKTGSVANGSGADRAFVVPIRKGEQMGAGKELSYEITSVVKDPMLLSSTMDEARGIMRTVRHDLADREDSFEITQSASLASSVEEVTGSLQIAGFGIGLITLLGASIGLMNIMLVSVTERTHEIGVRKALGATPMRIRIQFLTEAIVICVIGGIVGIILGLAAGNSVSVFLGNGKFVVPWAWIGMGLALCVSVGIFSGLYPAIKASKLDPVEALRFE
ncbi:MAG TPA: ABC transporter permease [Catalimonadaceae bacterium]|nr:ABC transporter permease [Catalimonadaceae bacterium]HPI11612.1 ABC transporter permease [Catalimonadaceae bacterium]